MSYHFASRIIPYRYHKDRIIHELIEAGVTSYGLVKSESRYLPHIINEGEHIKAVIYGQHHNNSAMLVATDQRIIYIDKKPMAELMDEVSYEVVSGIEMDVHIFFATITLHTAVTNYNLRFVNLRCAEKFVQFIEDQRLKQQEKEDAKVEEITKFLPGYLYWIHEEEKKVKK